MKIIRNIFLTIILCCVAGIGGFYYEDKHQYVFELLGDEVMTVEVFSKFVDPGFTATSNDKDLSSEVTYNTIDTSIAETQTITYTFMNKTLTRTVHVVDKEAPTLTILGGEVIEWELNQPFNDLKQCQTSDNYDKDVEVLVTNNVDVTKEGTYEETFTAKDSSGNTTVASREVIVSKKNHVNDGVAVCMYHYLYRKNNTPADVNANYIAVETLNEEIDYLKKHHFYFPTFSELRDFVDGKLSLPGNSIILTFDDGLYDTLDLLTEVANQKQVPVTSFLITKNSGKKKVKKYTSEYLQFESHTHDMHHSGGTIGHGGVMTAKSVEEAVADLKTSIDICGNSNALAYPYGDTNKSSRKAAKEAGFKVAFTTKLGQVKQGDDPYLLPRVRMSNNQSLKFFSDSVS
ncbi:MAG: DUF5011 domain-containing protein [Erysipelotrichaceae bacterium]|nr:DUF5011 domain-containing protein [Erysipelotrichaceae bacterium]